MLSMIHRLLTKASKVQIVEHCRKLDSVSPEGGLKQREHMTRHISLAHNWSHKYHECLPIHGCASQGLTAVFQRNIHRTASSTRLYPAVSANHFIHQVARIMTPDKMATCNGKPLNPLYHASTCCTCPYLTGASRS